MLQNRGHQRVAVPQVVSNKEFRSIRNHPQMVHSSKTHLITDHGRQRWGLLEGLCSIAEMGADVFVLIHFIRSAAADRGSFTMSMVGESNIPQSVQSGCGQGAAACADIVLQRKGA